MSDPHALRQAFARRFEGPPACVVRAPGRVNLIGEHTDYNEGFVFPMAIDRWVAIALRPRADTRVIVHAADFDETATLELGAPSRAHGGWCAYVAGVAWALAQGGHRLRGWDGVIQGDVPIGAGLSSSAALEMAAARAFCAAGGIDWDPLAMARAGQRTENEWIGVRCGIMDQLVCATGREGHALLIDCRSLASRQVPLPGDVAVVVLDTSTRRGLVDSEYNARRRQCEEAARLLGVDALRDADQADLEALRGAWPDEATRRRARHVVTENARALRAAEALAAGDVTTMGRLMDESHASLREDFEVSTPALDLMADCARRARGCLGARMTGAGFGGCVVALVVREHLYAFTTAVAAPYERAMGLTARVYAVTAAAGAEVCP